MQRPSSQLGQQQQQQRKSNNSNPSMTKGGKPDKVNRVKGGPNRDLDTLMELQMNKVNININ